MCRQVLKSRFSSFYILGNYRILKFIIEKRQILMKRKCQALEALQINVELVDK